MPLSERARIEIYIPDIVAPAYQELLSSYEEEFTYAFGGCTTVQGLRGSYLSNFGIPVSDRLNVIYTDFDAEFDRDFGRISRYADAVRINCAAALSEEAVFVAVSRVFHSVD